MVQRSRQRTDFGSFLHALRQRAGLSQEDLAKLAGFKSHSVVSRAEQKDFPPVAAARALIEALAHVPKTAPYWWELSHLAELYALSDDLRAQRDDPPVIGLLAPNISNNQVWAGIVGAIEELATQTDHTVLLTQHKNKTELFFSHLYRLEESVRLAGIIAIPPHWVSQKGITRRMLADLNAVFDRLAARKIPIVFVDRRLPATQRIPYVGLDNSKAAEMAVDYPRRRGHRRIGGLFGVQGEGSPHKERLVGFQSTLSRHGLECDPRLIRTQTSDNSGGLRMAREILELPREDRPSAIVCSTYYLALSVVEAVNQRREDGHDDWQIPSTLSVIGIDHVPVIDAVRPKITRVSYDVSQIGRIALEKVLALIENLDDAEARSDTIVSSLRILDGASVAPLVSPVPAPPSGSPRPASKRVPRRRNGPPTSRRPPRPDVGDDGETPKPSTSEQPVNESGNE